MKKLFLLLLNLFIVSTFICCQNSDESEGERLYRYTGEMNVDGRVRYYLLNLPPVYYDSTGFPLVIALHGGGGKASQCESDYKLTEKANAEGFIIVYPEGVQSDGVLRLRTWNAGTCCDYAAENNIDDVHFISVLIDQLISKYKINPKRVYVTGMSNGAMLSYRLACEIPEKIAAIAPVSGTMVTKNPCNPSRPVPVLHIHSELDLKVPVKGGMGIAGYYYPAVDSVLQVWSLINACTPAAPMVHEFADYTFMQWQNCDSDISINYYLTKDGGHSWPGSVKSRPRADTPSQAIKANDLIWDFFKKHQLP